MGERTRAEASAGEQGRAQASRGEQMELPIGRVEESDGAYSAAVEDLVAAGLRPSCGAILRWVIEVGRRENGTMTVRKPTQRKVAGKLGLSPSTVCDAVRRVKAAGLLREVDGVWTLPLGWLVELAEEARPAAVEPEELPSVDEALEALGALGVFGGARQRSACSGVARVLIEESKAREDVNRVTRVPEVRAPGNGSGAPAGIEVRLARPWATRGGLESEDLVWAVEHRAKGVLQRLYWAAVEESWWDDSEDRRLRFLSICHHAAVHGKRPMGLLTTLCKASSDQGPLRSARVRDASRDWAADTRKRWRQDGVLVAAEVERQQERVCGG